MGRVKFLLIQGAVHKDVEIPKSHSTGIHHRLWHKDLRVTVFDVGQGSATLVEAPHGRVMLVDGGGFGGDGTED